MSVFKLLQPVIGFHSHALLLSCGHVLQTCSPGHGQNYQNLISDELKEQIQIMQATPSQSTNNLSYDSDFLNISNFMNFSNEADLIEGQNQLLEVQDSSKIPLTNKVYPNNYKNRKWIKQQFKASISPKGKMENYKELRNNQL